MYAPRADWIRTERYNPYVLLAVSGPIVFSVVLLLTPWVYPLVPHTGRLDAISTAVVAALIVSIDLWCWSLIQPIRVHLSPTGVAVSRPLVLTLRIPAEKLQLRRARPTSFGWVSYRGGIGFLLSPDQFEAAQGVLPLTERPARLRTSRPA